MYPYILLDFMIHPRVHISPVPLSSSPSTHLSIHSPTIHQTAHPLICSPAHLHVHPCIHRPTVCLSIHPSPPIVILLSHHFILPFIHPFSFPHFIQLSTHPPAHSPPTQASTHLYANSLNYSCIYLSIYLCVYFPTHQFIHFPVPSSPSPSPIHPSHPLFLQL